VSFLTNPKEMPLSIPKDLTEKLKKRADDKGFKSLSDYVTYILRQVLSRVEEDEKDKRKPSAQEDEEEIKQKLRDMGYLDQN